LIQIPVLESLILKIGNWVYKQHFPKDWLNPEKKGKLGLNPLD